MRICTQLPNDRLCSGVIHDLSSNKGYMFVKAAHVGAIPYQSYKPKSYGREDSAVLKKSAVLMQQPPQEPQPPLTSTKCTPVTIRITSASFMNPYSVRATKPIGVVLMMTPAIGMKLQMNTNSDKSPTPGIDISHMPNAVRPVFTNAIRACSITRAQCQYKESVLPSRPDPPHMCALIKESMGMAGVKESMGMAGQPFVQSARTCSVYDTSCHAHSLTGKHMQLKISFSECSETSQASWAQAGGRCAQG